MGQFYDWASQLIFPIRRPDKSKMKLKLVKKRQLEVGCFVFCGLHHGFA